MRIFITQVYVKPSFKFKLSQNLVKQLSNRINEKNFFENDFKKKYRGFDIIIDISSLPESEISDLKIKGPTIFNKDKQIEYVLYIPYEKVMCDEDRLLSITRYIIHGIKSILKKHNMLSYAIEDSEQFINNFISEIKLDNKYRYIEVSLFANESPVIW